ncbi:MAG: hypothetical protein GY940_01905, partial [bacterium]|nr:hypothetical protein [bacterium]
YRFRGVVGPGVSPNDQCAGDNPPYGAFINYYLKSEPKEEEVIITILDGEGNTVRTLKTGKKDESGGVPGRRRERLIKVPKKAGINRINWDLRYDKTKKIRLRTSPIGNKHVSVGPKGWRSFPKGDQLRGPLAAPGIYTVKLSVGKKQFKQKFTVKKDPHSTGTLEDIRAQLTVSLGIRKMLNSIADIINKSEIIRKQTYD